MASAVALADDATQGVGEPPLKPSWTKPSQACSSAGGGAICGTVQATTNGSGLFVITLYPAENGIKKFDLWSGTPIPLSKIRPKGICKSGGKDTDTPDQVGTFYVVTCKDSVKLHHHQTYCFSSRA